MAYRFKARSTTPGAYRLASGVLGQLIALGDIQEGVNRGDGGLGTFVVPDEDEVYISVNYGADGTEFEGTLVSSDLDEEALAAAIVAELGTIDANVISVNDEAVEIGTIGVVGLKRVT